MGGLGRRTAGSGTCRNSRTADFDLSLTGFDTQEIDDLLAIEDDATPTTAPPLPENPVSRTGDLWLCGRSTACYAAMRRARRSWRGSWATESRG